MMIVLWVIALLLGVGAIVWGAETFAEHLGDAAVALGVSSFALALLLAGAEPEELVTAVVASLRHSPGIALGDVIGANVTICLVALGVGAWVAPMAFSGMTFLYAGLGVPLGIVAAWFAWYGKITRLEGALLVALYAGYVILIWVVERQPPALGEVEELAEAEERRTPRKFGDQAPGFDCFRGCRDGRRSNLARRSGPPHQFPGSTTNPPWTNLGRLCHGI